MFPISGKLPFEIWLCSYFPDETFLPSDYLLFCLVCGQLDIEISSAHYHFAQGDLFLIQPGENYHVSSNGEFLVCVLRMDFYFMVRCCNYERPVFLTAPQNRLLTACIHPEQKRQLTEKIYFLTDEFYKEPPTAPARMTYYFYDFAYFFIENFRQDPMNKKIPPREQRIYVIKDYIESNYNSPLTLNELAGELGLTPQYLSGFIRKNMDTTFNTILYDIRYAHVLVDLVQTKEDITRIILNNGFPNTSGFNKMFRQRYHMTPSQYRKKEWKGDNAYKQFPQHLFQVENQSLYEQFTHIRNRQKAQQRTGEPVAAVLDSTRTSWFSNPWNLLVNLKVARQLLSFEYLNQLGTIKSHMPYKYARVERLIHPEILGDIHSSSAPAHGDSGSGLVFSAMDAIIDQFIRLSLTPLIVLQPEDNSSFFMVENIIGIVKSALIHAIDRYGLTYVSQWSFEIVPAASQDIDTYISYSAQLFHAIGGICGKIRCGGPLFELGSPPEKLCALLKGWFSQQIQPDFITLSVYPYVQDGVSLNPDINIRRLSELYREIQELQTNYPLKAPVEIPLYIVDFGFTHADHSYMNDTVFMAAYTLHNFIGMKDYAKIIAWPALSDITAAPAPSGKPLSLTAPGQVRWALNTNERLLIGGRGMLTLHSLFKPVFFALRYLGGLGEQLLDCQKGRIVTMNSNGDIVVILYNYVHPDAFYCQEVNHHIQLEQVNSFYDTAAPISFDICLNHLPAAKYQAVRFRLNKNFGSIIDVWAASGGICGVKNETLNYLRHTLAPKAEFYEIKNDGAVRILETVAPQEILSLIIQPMH